jgi:hypothetical protein
MSDNDRVNNQADESDSVEPVDGDSTKTSDDVDEGPVRRPLIRATLRHPGGAPPPPRQPPVFTMHQQERSGSQGGRGQNQNGRFVRDSGHPNKKKGSRDRSAHGGSQYASKDNSTGEKKRTPRPARPGENRSVSGNRLPSSRRDKGRSR